jgi:AraC-like DNA-binding protein
MGRVAPAHAPGYDAASARDKLSQLPRWPGLATNDRSNNTPGSGYTSAVIIDTPISAPPDSPVPETPDADALWRGALVALSLERHPAPRAFHRLDVEHASFRLLLRGRCRETYPLQVVDYRAFSAVFHPAGLACRVDVGHGGADLLRFDLGDDLLDGVSRVRQSFRQVRDLSGGPLAWTLLSLYGDLAHATACPLLVEEPTAEVVGALARGRRGAVMREPRWMDRISELIRHEFHRPLTLSRLAEVAGVSPVHLTQTYRRVYGHSMRDRVQRLRVVAACRLMRTTGRAAADVAADTGFADEAHLAAECRRLAARLPAETQRVIRASTSLVRQTPRLPVRPDSHA